MNVLAHIQAQIDAAGDELGLYRPAEVDWQSRALKSACKLVPWLTSISPGLRAWVEDVFNAPGELRAAWGAMRTLVALPREQVDEFDRLLVLDGTLRSSVTGEVVSAVVTKYLLDHDASATLRANGRSDYPDLYDSSGDYSTLPPFRRGQRDTAVETYGAAVKGTHRRPIRVPDGLEVKTCHKRFAVDCHHPHAGLHLVVLHHVEGRRLAVKDVALAFLSSRDYRESARNTTATTVKYSFGKKPFVSLMGRTA